LDENKITKLLEPFTVTTGVRQSCILSPLLFLMVINWVSKTAYKEPKGIQWTLQTRLEDLDFADDICMLSHHRYQDMQHQATCLEEKAKQTGLLINPQKTKTELKSLSLVPVLKVVLLQTCLSMAKAC
jgi:hypothetical protein